MSDVEVDKYELLRQSARRKRDLAIAEVKAEYRRELLAIKRLKDALEGEPRSKRGPSPRLGGPRLRSIAELVREYMPTDRQFTVTEMRTILSEVEPDRRFRRDSLRTTFMNLRREGYIRKVKRIGKGQVLWEATGKKPPETPFSALLLPDAVAVVLGENGPMRPLEIVVALQMRGYRPLLGGAAVAMERGPVLEDVYSLIRGQHAEADNWSRHFHREHYHLVMHNDPGNGSFDAISRRKIERGRSEIRGM